jgi:hypothetical protein
MNPYLLLAILLSVSTFAKADYYLCLSQEDVKRALNILKREKQVIHFTDDCEELNEENIMKQRIDSIEIIFAYDCRQIVVYGEELTGEDTGSLTMTYLDLAYTWVKRKGMAVNLADLLLKPLDYVCYTPFDWNTYSRDETEKGEVASTEFMRTTIPEKAFTEEQSRMIDFQIQWIKRDMERKLFYEFTKKENLADSVSVYMDSAYFLIIHQFNKEAEFSKKYTVDLLKLRSAESYGIGSLRKLEFEGMIQVQSYEKSKVIQDLVKEWASVRIHAYANIHLGEMILELADALRL